jgi:hypothetical protein
MAGLPNSNINSHRTAAPRDSSGQTKWVKTLSLLMLSAFICGCQSNAQSSTATSCSTNASSSCGGPLVLPAQDRYAVCQPHWADFGNLATYAGCYDYMLSAYTATPCKDFDVAVFSGTDDFVKCYYDDASGSLISIVYAWQCESCVAGPASGVAVPETDACAMQRRQTGISSCSEKDASDIADALSPP